MNPVRLDHVAFWVAERATIVGRCVRYLGLHVIDEQDDFTLVGSDARYGKLTFFDAEGPRRRGALVHVGLRVSNLDEARGMLPPTAVDSVDVGDGVRIRLVERPTPVEYDLDHLVLLAPDPDATARAYESYGFACESPASVVLDGVSIAFQRGEAADDGRPLLNHLGLLVVSAEEHRLEAERRGLQVESVVDAPNTFAVFVNGPGGIRIEYVEHKPTFALT